MRVLFDEMMPRPLKPDLVGHAVVTVTEAGWSGLKNGALLALAQKQFDAFVTMDSNLPFQQRLESFQLRFVIVHAVNNKLETLRPLVPEMLAALESVQLGQVIHVPRP
jgi:hypothetical protein